MIKHAYAQPCKLLFWEKETNKTSMNRKEGNNILTLLIFQYWVRHFNRSYARVEDNFRVRVSMQDPLWLPITPGLTRCWVLWAFRCLASRSSFLKDAIRWFIVRMKLLAPEKKILLLNDLNNYNSLSHCKL